ncbi:MAG: MerR family transcriptional regulator [Jhaorihella sp.]
MAKSPDAFRTISEVAEWLGIPTHVLRFWESKFSQVKPVKRAGGRRYYRPGDMLLLGGIRKLLHDDGLTIKGVQKILREQGVAHVSSLSHPTDELAPGMNAVTVESDGGEVRDAPREAAGDTVVQFQGRGERPANTPGDTPAEPIVRDREQDGPAASDDTPDAEPAAAPAPEAQPQTGALPAFLNRQPAPKSPAPDNPPPAGEVQTSEAASAGEPAAPRRARVVDAPDPPAEDSIACSPGPLSRLAALELLTATQAREIAPLAARLRGWLDSNRHAGAG